MWGGSRPLQVAHPWLAILGLKECNLARWWWQTPLISHTLEAEAVGSLWVPGQLGLPREFQNSLQPTEKLCLEKQNNKNKKLFIRFSVCISLHIWCMNHVHTRCPQCSEVAILSCLRAIMYVDAGNPTKIQGKLLLNPQPSFSPVLGDLTLFVLFLLSMDVWNMISL